jgi:hypothetical protein
MYQKILVKPGIEWGEQLLEALNGMNFPVTAAFWLYSEDVDDWRLVIVSPLVASDGPREAYTRLSMLAYDLLHDPKRPIEIPIDRVFLVSPEDFRYKQVRSALLGHSPGGPVGGSAMADAYVYRMS